MRARRTHPRTRAHHPLRSLYRLLAIRANVLPAVESKLADSSLFPQPCFDILVENRFPKLEPRRLPDLPRERALGDSGMSPRIPKTSEGAWLTMQGRGNDAQQRRIASVRRRLFSDDDDNENNRNPNNRTSYITDVMEEMRARRAESMRYWNFDFERGVPLPGRFQWVRLDRSGNEIPSSIVNPPPLQDRTNRR